jgi:NAD(P)-dependent dehydrogenase (short-subunit alcohol dehydrogenase family)
VESTCDFNLEGDVRDSKLIETVIGTIENTNPSFLVLVNNAGITIPQDNSLHLWDEEIRVNLTAPYLWMTAFNKHFEDSNIDGSIINITSVAAELALPHNPSYVASKGGMKQLTKAFALKLGSIGVTCNNVGPDDIQTKFNSGSLSNPKVFLKRPKRSMLNRWRLASKVADAARFLVSVHAIFMTDEDMCVDGGWLARGIN